MRFTHPAVPTVIALFAVSMIPQCEGVCGHLSRWNPESKQCSTFRYCSEGQPCDDSKLQFCTLGSFCNSGGTCQNKYPVGQRCDRNEQCSSGACIDSTCLSSLGECGPSHFCGAKYFCSRTNGTSANQCLERKELEQDCDLTLGAPDQMCTAGLTCAPQAGTGVGKCVPLYSVPEGGLCVASTHTQCIYGLDCLAGTCGEIKDLDCSETGDAGCGSFPNSYCNCASGKPTCARLYNTDCEDAAKDLRTCMTNEGASFSETGVEFPDGAIGEKCGLEYFDYECCQFHDVDWLYGSSSPVGSPMNMQCGSNRTAGWAVTFILIVVAAAFIGAAICACLQFSKRGQSYARLPTIDEEDDDTSSDEDDKSLAYHMAMRGGSLYDENRIDPFHGPNASSFRAW